MCLECPSSVTQSDKKSSFPISTLTFFIFQTETFAKESQRASQHMLKHTLFRELACGLLRTAYEVLVGKITNQLVVEMNSVLELCEIFMSVG